MNTHQTLQISKPNKGLPIWRRTSNAIGINIVESSSLAKNYPIRQGLYSNVFPHLKAAVKARNSSGMSSNLGVEPLDKGVQSMIYGWGFGKNISQYGFDELFQIIQVFKERCDMEKNENTRIVNKELRQIQESIEEVKSLVKGI